MPDFYYQASNKKGKKITATVNAKSPLTVARELNEKGYKITSIKKVNESSQSNKKRKKLEFKKNEKINLINFSKQLSVLIKAGIPIVEAIKVLNQKEENDTNYKVMNDIIESLQAGGSFYEALNKKPNYFPHLYQQMIRAGEKTGLLEEVLNELSKYYDWQLKLKNEIKSVLYYPIIVLAVALTAIFFMLVYVVPAFSEIFEAQNSQMPLITIFIVNVSYFLADNLVLIIVFLVTLILIIFKFLKTDKAKDKIDFLKINLPVVGKIYGQFVMIRIASILSLLLDNGLNLSESLELLENIVDNQVLKRELFQYKCGVQEGKQLSKLMKKSSVFTSLYLKLIKVGEETGSLSVMLVQAVEFYEREVRLSLNKIITFIEPVMLVLMAMVVGFIALAVILPMFNMYTIF
ncbi:MAG: type II secretion system F family protein [Bacillota bacterium]